MKKQILLASLLSMGILSAQSVWAFKPGSPEELKAEAKVEKKVEVFIYLDENDQPTGGYEFQILDLEVSDSFFDLMDQAGISYGSNSDDDDAVASEAAKKSKKGKKVKMKSADWCAKHPDTCRGSDPANGGSGYWKDNTSSTESKGGSSTANPVDNGSGKTGFKGGKPAGPGGSWTPQ